MTLKLCVPALGPCLIPDRIRLVIDDWDALCLLEAPGRFRSFSVDPHDRGGTLRVMVRPPIQSGRRAFTLVEMLVTVGVIGALLGLLLPSLRGALGAARGLRCQATQREIVSAFQVFADDQLNEGRGDDRSRGRQFQLVTFQDSLYGVDEFWKYGDDTDMIQLPLPTGVDPTRCSEVHGAITLRRGIECTDGAISPAQNMSFGFNRRLHREEVVDSRGRVRTRQVYLTSDVLAYPDVPLLWDVDASAAAAANFYPGFSAPSLESRGAYGSDRFWRPALRHNGAMNVAFLDGHVSATRNPLKEASWRWGFQFGDRR